MHAADPLPGDLMTPAQIEAEYGVPGAVVRQWASRGRVIRYPGLTRRQGTMYARQHIAPLAQQYQPVPQRGRRP